MQNTMSNLLPRLNAKHYNCNWRETGTMKTSESPWAAPPSTHTHSTTMMSYSKSFNKLKLITLVVTMIPKSGTSTLIRLMTAFRTTTR